MIFAVIFGMYRKSDQPPRAAVPAINRLEVSPVIERALNPRVIISEQSHAHPFCVVFHTRYPKLSRVIAGQIIANKVILYLHNPIWRDIPRCD